MAELADALDLGSSVFNMQVRSLLPAPKKDTSLGVSFKFLLKAENFMI